MLQRRLNVGDCPRRIAGGVPGDRTLMVSFRQIRIEREAVAGYFENLRGVLQQAEKATADRD